MLSLRLFGNKYLSTYRNNEMFDDQPLSMHIVIAIAISLAACVWAFFRLKSPSDNVRVSGDDNPLQDAEIINGQTYM